MRMMRLWDDLRIEGENGCFSRCKRLAPNREIPSMKVITAKYPEHSNGLKDELSFWGNFGLFSKVNC